jgi:hypothetical protein
MNTGEGCRAVTSRSDAEASLILSASELRLGKPCLCRVSEFGSTAGQSSPARPPPTRAEQANTSAVIAVRNCDPPEPRGRIPRRFIATSGGSGTCRSPTSARLRRCWREPLVRYHPCQAVGDRRAMASSIAARRRTSSNGLSICPAKPAAFMRRWSALLARPEMAMTGWCVWPSKLRSA